MNPHAWMRRFMVFPNKVIKRGVIQRNANDPFTGKKLARIDVDSVTGRFCFSGLYTHAPYGVEAHAECAAFKLLEEPHRVPVLNCACGFYAYKPETYDDQLGHFYETTVYPLTAVLTVELAGRVIVAQYGYRAEYQRVMKATLCNFRCTQVIPTHPLASFTGNNNYYYATSTRGAYDAWAHPLCNEHAVAVRRPDAMRRHALTTDNDGSGITFCAEHAKKLDPMCWPELDFDVLDRLRTDLPTDWETV